MNGGLMDGEIDKQKERWEYVNVRIAGWIGGWITDGGKDGREDGWIGR